MIARLHERKEGDFMKKVLKCIGIIILFLMVFLIIHTIRNMIIMKQISNKVGQYKNYTNYYIKTTSNQGNVVDFYRKDNQYIMKVLNTSHDGVRKLTNYFDGEKVNTYIETETENGLNKVALLNSNGLPSAIEIKDLFYEIKGKELVLMALLANIKSVQYNGTECYKITDFYGFHILSSANFEFYFEKETGLEIREQNGLIIDENGKSIPMIVDYKYKFDVVTDDDLAELDISEYKIQGKNAKEV